MPNWCDNDLTITGPKATLTAIAKLIGLTDETPVFDFNRVIEYPQEYAEADKKASASRTNGDWSVPDGYNHGGYNWCVQKWGTKWNVGDDVHIKSLEPSIRLNFNTAWGPPEGVIKTLARQFPTVKISLRYFECGAAFQGRLVIEKGDILEEETKDYHGRRGG